MHCCPDLAALSTPPCLLFVKFLVTLNFTHCIPSARSSFSEFILWLASTWLSALRYMPPFLRWLGTVLGHPIILCVCIHLRTYFILWKSAVNFFIPSTAVWIPWRKNHTSHIALSKLPENKFLIIIILINNSKKKVFLN